MTADKDKKKKTSTAGKKPAKGTSSKTATAKKAAPKSGKMKKAAAAPQRSMAPLVLVIMALSTAVILLMNRQVPVIKNIRKTAGEHPRKMEQPRQKAPEEKKAIPEKTVEKEDKKAAEKPVPEKKLVTARIYLLRLNEKEEKVYLSPVTRKVSEEGRIKETLEELIRGADRRETGRGYLTAVPAGLRIRSVRMRNRTAEIDFSGALEEGASGSILVNRLDQIVYTATQFNDVDSIVITINGERRKTLGSDGLSIQGPLHRRK